MKKLIFLCFAVSIFSCKNDTSEEKIPVEPNNGIGNGATPPKVFSFSENIEEAHNKTAFAMNEAISFDIDLNFGGSPRLQGTVSMTTNSSKVRVDRNNGSSIIYDGKKIAITPGDAEADGARFDIFTWQYFFALPFKLTDPGTVWEAGELRSLDSIEYKTAKLSFEDAIGDSPDDWYVIYQDPETRLLKAAAYIVTFNTNKQEAEQNPHAIVYSNFETVNQVSIASKWSFHNWSETDGFGKKIGEATLSNIKFFSPEEDDFRIPENSKNIEK